MSAFCQQNWTQVDEDNLAVSTLSKVIHPDLPAAGWEVRTSDYAFVCRHCRCQIEPSRRYYWHSTGWLAYHPQCVQAEMERRAKG